MYFVLGMILGALIRRKFLPFFDPDPRTKEPINGKYLKALTKIRASAKKNNRDIAKYMRDHK